MAVGCEQPVPDQHLVGKVARKRNTELTLANAEVDADESLVVDGGEEEAMDAVEALVGGERSVQTFLLL